MDISLPYKWIKEYINTDISYLEFARLMTLGGVAIEKWHEDKLLEDTILEIEVAPNRPDALSVIGVAREASAILNLPLNLERFKIQNVQNKNEIAIKIENFDRCYRYESVVIEDVDPNAKTPEFITNRLKSLGMNSVNVLVDISNYVLKEYGQPTHVFDFEKINGKQIVVRDALKGETLTTLDNQTLELDENDLVIADATSPIGLAGIKGGISTGISSSTTKIVLESASFEPYKLRNSARRHQLHTDASKLFDKGLSRLSTTPAIERLAELILEYAGGRVVSDLITIEKEKPTLNKIRFEFSLIEKIIGTQIPKDVVENALIRLDFTIENKTDTFLDLVVPYHRSLDIVYDYDIPEEIVRLYGYSKIPNAPLAGAYPHVSVDPEILWESSTKKFLRNIGYTEIFSEGLIGKKELAIANLAEEDVVALHNPLSSDAAFLRSELTSTMIRTIQKNEPYSQNLSLFELQQVFINKEEFDLPHEHLHLCISKNAKTQLDAYLEVKGTFEAICDECGISESDVEYIPNAEVVPFRQSSSAKIKIKNEVIGSIGLIDNAVIKSTGIKLNFAVLEVNFTKLVKFMSSSHSKYRGIPKYPSVYRDFSFIASKNILWSQIKESILPISEFTESIQLFDVYTGDKIGNNNKSMSVRVVFRSSEKTLTDEEVSEVQEKIYKTLTEKFSAQIR